MLNFIIQEICQLSEYRDDVNYQKSCYPFIEVMLNFIIQNAPIYPFIEVMSIIILEKLCLPYVPEVISIIILEKLRR